MVEIITKKDLEAKKIPAAEGEKKDGKTPEQIKLDALEDAKKKLAEAREEQKTAVK